MSGLWSRTRSLSRSARHSSALLLVLVAALLACSTRPPILEPPRLAVNRSLEYEFGGELFQYKNGMRIMVVPESNTNMIKIDMRYEVGSAEDPPGKAGLAHLAEHMLFEVPSSGPGSPSVETYLGKTALYYNAYTSWDETHFTSIAPRKLLNAMLFLESRRMQARCEHFDGAAFEREREVVRNEIRQRSGLGSELADMLHRDVYGSAHPYHRSIGGSDTELAAITRRDVCDFVAEHYAPNTAILVVSGKLNAGKVLALASSLFEDIPARATPERAAINRPALRGTQSTHRLAIEQPTALVAFAASRFSDYDASYDYITRRLLARALIQIMNEHEFITNYDVVRAGGVRAPLNVVAISVSSAETLPKAVELIFELKSALSKELDRDLLRGLTEKARADLIASVEPFMDEAVALADHLQYADDTRFILPRLEAYKAMKPSVLAEHIARRIRRDQSHVVYVYSDESKTPKAARAELNFAAKEFEIEDWQAAIDIAEADRDVPITSEGLSAQVDEFNLPNGLRVLLASGLGYPVVDIRLVVPAGNLHEPPELAGLADLAADAMRPGPFVFSERVNHGLGERAFNEVLQMGGRISGTVGARTTTLRIPGMSMYTDGLLWQLYWHLRTGRYPRKNLAVRRAVLGRSETAQTRRSRRQLKALLGALFGAGHEYVNRISTAQLLERVTIKDLDQFRRRHYQMRGATLIVTGEFPRDQIENEIRRLFGTLPNGDAPAPRRVADGRPPDAPVYLAFPDDKSVQTQIVLAFPVSGSSPHHNAERRADTRAVRRVVSAMLELELSSLRTQLGASYGAHVSYLSLGGPRMLLITAAADSERAHEAYAAMLAAIERVRAKRSASAFVRARKQVLRRLLSDSLDSRSVAAELELQAVTGLPPNHWRALAEAVAKLRQDDLMPIIRGDLDSRRMVVTIDGKRAAIERLYRAAGVSEPRYVE